MMVEHSDDHSFSSFAALPFYVKINARLLDIAEIGNERRIVDLGLRDRRSDQAHT